MSLAEHSRSLVAYTVWANDKVLHATSRLSTEEFVEVRDNLTHLLGTQQFWYARWTGEAYQDHAYETFAQLHAAYQESHRELTSIAAALTDESWQRREAWWTEFGYQHELEIGKTVTQVVTHGIQHRSEVAVVISAAGQSPGDLDYLNFLMHEAGIHLDD